jgi:hypothetical protein
MGEWHQYFFLFSPPKTYHLYQNLFCFNESPVHNVTWTRQTAEQKAQRVESSAQNINLINVGYENIIRKKRRRRRNVIGDWPSAIQKRKETKRIWKRCRARQVFRSTGKWNKRRYRQQQSLLLVRLGCGLKHRAYSFAALTLSRYILYKQPAATGPEEYTKPGWWQLQQQSSNNSFAERIIATPFRLFVCHSTYLLLHSNIACKEDIPACKFHYRASGRVLWPPSSSSALLLFIFHLFEIFPWRLRDLCLSRFILPRSNIRFEKK